MSDPISTIDAAVGEINRLFGTGLPRLGDLGPQSVLARLWGLSAVVQADPPAPILFKACATNAGFPLAGNLTGQFIIFVTSGEDAPLTPCATSSAARPSPARAPVVALDTSTKSVRFGIILDINGTSVAVVSGDISSEGLKTGAELTMQDPIVLGSIDKFEIWVGDNFGVHLPMAKDLPQPLDTVIGKITGMTVTVESAHIKLPGESSADGVGYTLETTGTFDSPIPLIPGALGVESIVFGFSNEAADSSGGEPESLTP